MRNLQAKVQPARVRRALTKLCCVTLALPLAALTLAGCSGGTVPVTGKVTLDGKVLSAGTVTFLNEQQKSVQTSIISKDGTYSVQIATGPCKITVTVPPTAGDMPEGMKMDPSKMGAAGKAATVDAQVVDVPAKYKDMKTTPLAVTLESGQKTHNIEMKADPKTDQ